MKEEREVFVGDRYERQMTGYEKLLDCCGGCCGCIRLYAPCVNCCCVNSPAVWIQTSEVGLLQKFGKFVSEMKPGLNFINPMTENILTLDLRTRILDPAKQPVLTKDNISLQLDSSVYYRVTNPKVCAYKIGSENSKIDATVLEMCHSSVRTVCGEHTFQQILEDRVKISEDIKKCMQDQLSVWGLHIEFVFLKDLHLNHETERNLSSAAVNLRVSEARIIAAKAEVESAKMLKQASDILNSKAAMQIRYLQVMQKIASSPNIKIMFVPLNNSNLS